MKKVISLLVAIVAATSVSVAAFAADDVPGIVHRSALVDADTYAASVGESGDIFVGKNELYLVDSENKIVGGIYNRLIPDNDYTFKIYWNNSGADIQNSTDSAVIAAGKELKGSDLVKGTIRLRTIKGSSNIQSAKIRTIGRGDNARYELKIDCRENYGTKINDVSYTLHVTGSTQPTGTFEESEHNFEVGFDTIRDEDTDVGEDGYLTMANDRPVVEADQFKDIARSANYKAVNIEGEDGDWSLKARVSGMKDSNFFYSYDVVPEIVEKLPDQEYYFLNFKGGVNIPSSSEMRINVDEIFDDYNNIYAYLYRNGKLTRIETTLDSNNMQIVFRTNYLGAFVLTDTEITDTTILDTGVEEDKDTDTDTDTDAPTTDDNNGNNPSTGAAGALNTIAGLGLASLGSAGVIRRKRK